MSQRERWLPPIAGLAGLAVVGWLGFREAAAVLGDRDAALARVADARLDGARRDVSDWLLGLQDSLWSTLEGVDDSRLDSLGRFDPLAVAGFRTVRGSLVFPDTLDGLVSRENRAFAQRTARLWSGRAVLASSGRGTEGGSPLRALEWIPWHWEDGLHFLVRRPVDDSVDVGLEIDRTALLARMVGDVELRELGGGSIDLVDGAGRLLHRWGSHEPDSSALDHPMAAGALGAPFEGWTLRVNGLEAAWAERSRMDALRSILLRWGIAAAVWLLVVFLVSREWTRAVREARQRTGFVQQVSHELRTPLTNIRLHAELARDGTLEDDTFRHLEVVGQETERLSRLVANILAFARSEKEPVRVQPVRTGVDALLDSALGPFAPVAARSGVTIERRVDAPAGSEIVVDPDAATQILQNLVGNAFKYASSGKWIGIEFALRTEHWEIRVRDRGPGIPASQRERVFAPFYRLSDRIEGVAGTGIGLGIARDLARAHGGDLTIEPGTPGTTFLWILPRSLS